MLRLCVELEDGGAVAFGAVLEDAGQVPAIIANDRVGAPVVGVAFGAGLEDA